MLEFILRISETCLNVMLVPCEKIIVLFQVMGVAPALGSAPSAPNGVRNIEIYWAHPPPLPNCVEILRFMASALFFATLPRNHFWWSFCPLSSAAPNLHSTFEPARLRSLGNDQAASEILDLLHRINVHPAVPQNWFFCCKTRTIVSGFTTRFILHCYALCCNFIDPWLRLTLLSPEKSVLRCLLLSYFRSFYSPSHHL